MGPASAWSLLLVVFLVIASSPIRIDPRYLHAFARSDGRALFILQNPAPDTTPPHIPLPLLSPRPRRCGGGGDACKTPVCLCTLRLALWLPHLPASLPLYHRKHTHTHIRPHSHLCSLISVTGLLEGIMRRKCPCVYFLLLIGLRSLPPAAALSCCPSHSLTLFAWSLPGHAWVRARPDLSIYLLSVCRTTVLPCISPPIV